MRYHHVWDSLFAILVALVIVRAIPCCAGEVDGLSQSLSRIERSSAALDPHTLQTVTGPDGEPSVLVKPEYRGSLSEEQARALLGQSEVLSGDRYIVQFDRPPAAIHKAPAARTLALNDLKIQHNRFRDDLGRIKADLLRAGKRVSPGGEVRLRREYFLVLNGAAMTLTDDEVVRVRELPYVKRVSREVQVRASLATSVPLINADDVWNLLGAQGTGIVVAIIDTGVDYNHANLGAGFGPAFKVIGGYDFANDDSNPMDDHGHGTHVAGIVAASGSVKGVAPQAKLMAYKVLNAYGYGTDADVIAGIERACDPDGNPATSDAVDVLNMSLGGSGNPDDAMSQAVDNAVGLGVVCAVAAGNDGNYETIGSPGCARHALTVGATDDSNAMAYFSSRGPAAITYDIKPEVCAPGMYIDSTRMGGGTTSMSGTSMAAPHVAGASALLLQLHPTWTPAQVKSALVGTALNLGRDIVTQGAGRIDVYAAAQTKVLIEPGTINLGKDDLSLATWTVTRSLTITNAGSSPATINLSVDASLLPTGITTSLPPSVTLDAGASTTVDFQVTVDNTAVPNIYAPPWVYYGWVVAQSGASTFRFPFAFNKEQPDTMEPNNDAAHAHVINVEGKRKQVFELGRTKIDPTEPGASNPDYDWFRFTGVAGQKFCAYVDTDVIGSTLWSGLELYNSSLSLLASGTAVSSGSAIKYYAIPSNGDYYLRVLGNGGTIGQYKLFVNVLPSEVRWYWQGGNTPEQVSFSDGGDYVYTSQYFNYLTLFQSGGTGTPVYNLTASGTQPLWPFETSENSSTFLGARLLGNDDDTWTYNGTNWAKESPAASPSRRQEACMAYDAARGVTILFGGRNDDGVLLNDTWSWNGTNWAQLSPATVPPARYRTGMVYDSARQVLVLFGGNSNTGLLNDTWEWNGTNWTQRYPASAPSPRYGFGFAFDSGRNVTVLFGGISAAQETWEYNGTDWTRRFPVTTPSSGSDCTMCYDPARAETVLVTNYPANTYTWNGTNWTLEAGTLDVATGSWNTVFDSARNVIVLATQYSWIGGDYSPYIETWEWNGTTWTKISTASAPVRRHHFGLAYDAARSETVLFGGRLGASGIDWTPYFSQKLEKRVTPSSTAVSTEILKYPNNLASLKVSADGSRQIATDASGIKMRDASGTVIATIPTAYPTTVLRITPDASLAVLYESQTSASYLTVHDLNANEERFRVAITVHGVDDIFISDDGSRLAQVQAGFMYGHQWNGTTYAPTWRYDTGGFGEWIYAAGMSGNGSLVMAVVRYTSGAFGDTGQTYHVIDGATGRRLSTYHEEKDPAISLQMVPQQVSINYDGSFAAASTWGGDRRYAEMVVFSPYCGAPILELGTPGSGYCLDVKGTYASIGTKGVHANMWGGAGELYLVQMSGLLTHIPPLVTDVTALPWRLDPGATVTIRCKATDSDGVASVVAQIEAPEENLIAAVSLYDDGAHGDGCAGDGIWANSWATGPTPRDYVVDIQATDGSSNAALYNNCASFSTFDRPWVNFQSCTLYDRTRIGPGITNHYSITLRNQGNRTAKSVTARTYSNDPYVTACPSSAAYGDIAAGATKTSGATAFAITVAANAPGGHVISVNLVNTDAEGHVWEERFDLPSVGGRPVDHFEWDAVSSPKWRGRYFDVTIRAKDQFGNATTDFTDAVDLVGRRPEDVRSIGAGTGTWAFPMYTYYHDARTQVIYLASEIGSAGRITSLALDVASIPGQQMDNWTIRVKHTPLSSYAAAAWEGSGWTVVYQSDQTVSTTGWVTFQFTTPFEYNGTDNLMVDFSFNNSSWTSEGICRVSTPGGNRSIYYYTDSGAGDPLSWSGISPSPWVSANVPNLRLGFSSAVPVDPASTGSFASGVWSGRIAVLDEALGMTLLASDGSGHTGESNSFDVLGTIAYIKKQPNGETVHVRSGILTAVFGDYFYLEDYDRASGIRVHRVGHGLSPGMKVNVDGELGTNDDGERFIEASSAVQNGSGSVEALGFRGAQIGGRDYEYVPGSSAGQKGVLGGTGLNNIGLLVCTWGEVTYAGADYFYLDDGSGAVDNSGHAGVKVLGTVPVPQGEDPVGRYVEVTGISSCFKVDPNLYRVIRATEVVLTD